MTTPAYEVTGEGPPLILLHSSMSSRLQWRGLIDELSSEFRCIAIDLYGYGGTVTPHDSDGFSLSDEVALVESVAKELGLEQPLSFVGHSYGGAVALAFAQAYPNRVARLVLFEPVAFSILDEGDDGWRDLEPTLRVFDETQQETDSTEMARTFVDYWNGEGAFDAMPERQREQLAGLVEKTRLDFQALLGHPFDSERLTALVAPVTLLTGRDSRASAHAVVDQLACWVPRANVIVTQGGHMAPLRNEADINPYLVEALRRD